MTHRRRDAMNLSQQQNETVTARVLTAPAPGAIAVIELRGRGAADALRAVTRKRSDDSVVDFVENRLVLCRVVDGAETLDDALAVTWSGGSAAELNLHGGVRIVQRVMNLLQRTGVKCIGDATNNDTHGDPVNWLEAEVDAAMMTAHTRRMTRWLLTQRRLLPDLVHAGPMQSVDPELVRRARAAAALVRGLTVAIVGPPNAGKSTLANRLIGHERVITSDIPGTTRDWVSETASIRGWPITLTDTAGIRTTTDAIEREAIHRGLQAALGADLIVVVLDATRTIADRATDLATIVRNLPPDRPRLLVLNKSDLLASITIPANVPGMVCVSALTGTGRDELEAAIAMRLDLESLESDAAAPFTARQWMAIGLADADRIGARS